MQEIGYRNFTQGTEAGRAKVHLSPESVQDRLVPLSHGYRKGPPRNLRHQGSQSEYPSSDDSVEKREWISVKLLSPLPYPKRGMGTVLLKPWRCR